MKLTPVALLCAGMIISASALGIGIGSWQNQYWSGEIVFDKGSYSADPGVQPVSAQEGTNIKIPPGCLMNGLVIMGGENVTWDVQGSLFLDVRLGCARGDRFNAKDTLFQSFQGAFGGSPPGELWSARWTFENCVFAGKFMTRVLTTKYTSFRATHCTFYDLDLPKVTFTGDPAMEAQAEELRFVGSRFVRCVVPESLLAATIDCVFEDCHFSTQREDWTRATKPILVTAIVTGKTPVPASYANGNLELTFKSLQAPPGAPPAGATIAHDYANQRLSFKETTSFGKPKMIGTVRNKPLVSTATPPAAVPETTPPPSPAPAPAVFSGDAQERTAEMVKAHRNNLVFVSGSDGAGSGFLAKFGPKVYLVTNAHVAAGIKGAGFQTLQGEKVQAGTAAIAVGHDLFLMQSAAGEPFEVMNGVDSGASIGDDIVVLGNAEGAGVINTIMGKIVGFGPNLVEVDAPFQPGNSGSPIIHLKSGKVIAAATYLTYRKYDPATKQPVKDPVVRRFGYRLDSVKTWQPVLWPTLFAQAKEMETIEALTKDLDKFLVDLNDGKVNSSAHSNPAIKTRIDAWLASKSRGLSLRDRQSANQSFLSFLKVTCQSDIIAARSRFTYDYFQRALSEEDKIRVQMGDFFDKLIKDLQASQ